MIIFWLINMLIGLITLVVIRVTKSKCESSDPIDIINHVNKLLDEIKDPKAKEIASNIADNALNHPAMFIVFMYLLLCIPLLNIVFLYFAIKDAIKFGIKF